MAEGCLLSYVLPGYEMFMRYPDNNDKEAIYNNRIAALTSGLHWAGRCLWFQGPNHAPIFQGRGRN